MPDERIIPLDESNRAKRRSAVPQGELKTKALPRIGKGPGLVEQATFDPNAEDGDGDGLVQDNTPFERPALLKPIVDAVRGLASGTGSPVKESTRGKTNRQIAEEAVSATTPEEFKRDVIAQALSMGVLSDDAKIASVEKNIRNILDIASFSPEDRAFVVDAIEKALDESPEFRELVDLFGMPPAYAIRRTSGGMLGAYLASVPAIGIRANQSEFDSPIGEYEFTGILSESVTDIIGAYLPVPGKRKFTPDRSPNSTFVHEYGHHLAALGWMNHPSAEKRDAFFAFFADDWGRDEPSKFPSEELSGLRELLDYARSFTEGERLQAPGDEVPMVESAYGLTSPAEFWAESFMAYLSPDPKVKGAINQPMRDLIEALLPTSTHLGKGNNYKPAPTTGNTMSWMSPAEIADAVVSKSADEARKMLVGHWRQLATQSQRQYSDERILGIIEGELKSYFGENATLDSVFALDYGSQQKLREMVEKSLSDRPELLDAVRKFGMPPILTTTPEVQKAWGKKSAGIAATAMADHLPMIMINPEIHDAYLNGERPETTREPGMLERLFNRAFGMRGIDGTGGRLIVDTSPEGVLAHEWGHYLAKVAAWGHPDGDVRELARFYFAESWDAGQEMGASLGGTLEQRTQDLSGYVRTIKKGGKPDPDAPFVLTRYGQTSPAETFAEGIAALMSPNKKDRDLVSPALKEDINRVLGKPNTESEPRSAWLGSTTPQERGMRSSFRPVRRRDDGTREFRENTSPLRDGASWLRDASNEEIADAVVAQTLDDAAVLTAQFISYGKGPQTPEETRALKAFAKWYLQYGADRTVYDFSPETVAKMRSIVKQALDESPEFAWFVRNYGMPPVLAISGDTPAEVALKVPQMLTGDPSKTAAINPMHSNENIMGMTFGNMMIVINPNSPSIRDNAPSGFIPAGHRHMTGRIQQVNPMTGQIDTFIPNMGKSGADTLRHEWGHWFYFSFLGTPAMYGGNKGMLEAVRNLEGGPTPPWAGTSRNRNDRSEWYAAATGRDATEILEAGSYLKNVFDQSRLWWAADPEVLTAALSRLEALQIIGYDLSTGRFVPGAILSPTMSTPENRALGNTIIGYINSTVRISFTPNGEVQVGITKWTPDFAYEMTSSIETLIKNLLGRAGDPGPPIPRIAGMYAGSNPQEILAESFAVFTSPDPSLKERYMSDDIVEMMARLFGLQTIGSRDPASRQQGRPEVGGIKIVSPPWEDRGIAAPERTRADVIATLPQRTMVPRENLTSKERIGSSEVAITVDRGDAGNFTITEPDGRQWTVSMGAEPRDSFETAYDSWVSNNHSQIRNASAEIMAMARPETRINPIPEDYAHAVAMLDDVSNSKTFSNVPGYRVIGGVLDTDDLLAVEIGESIDMPLSSFNPDESDAKLAISQSSGGALGKTVVVRLAEGARVSEPDESYEVSVKKNNGNIVKARAEMVTQGRFKVVKRTAEDGYVVVDIDHVSTFDPLSGEMSDLPQTRVRGVRYKRNSPPQQDSYNEVPSGREIGGFRSAAPIRDRARDLGVSLDAYDSEENDSDDIEWSSNDWSFSKTGPVQAGDAVIVRNSENGKEVLMISRKSGPFREALALPGGLRDEGETLYDSADREMFEEVGISVGQTRFRKPLGEIEARDWDPRFAAGGVIGGVLYEVEPDVRAEAADDARGLQWISLEALSRGDQAIAFGHASWLAEAFRSDPVLGPRFALLAEASRIRNHRLIEKINERRAAAGVQQFPELPDPNSPYVTVDSGLGRGRKAPERGMSSSSARPATVKNKAEDLSPEKIAEYESRQGGLEAATPEEITEMFTDGDYTYVVHFGAEEIVGDTMDPQLSRGSDSPVAPGQTRYLNREKGRQYEQEYRRRKSNETNLLGAIAALREGRQIDLYGDPSSPASQSDDLAGYTPRWALNKVFVKGGLGARRGVRDEDRFRPWPDQDDLDAIGMTREELANRYEEFAPRVLQEWRDMESVVLQLQEDDYQHTSGYSASFLVRNPDINPAGYGGRYDEEGGDEWRTGAGAERMGIHVMRVRIGDNAGYLWRNNQTDPSVAEEVAMVGKHPVVASLQLPTWGRRIEGENGQSWWKGWLADVVDKDKETRRNIPTEENERGMRSSSTRSAFGVEGTNPDQILEKFDRELEPINEEIRAEEDFAERLAKTIETLRETGEWTGGDNNVYINEGNTPRNRSKEELQDVEEVVNAAEKALSDRRRKLRLLREKRDSTRDAIEDRRRRASERLARVAQSDNTVDIEEILSNPGLVNELRSIAKQVSDIPYRERSKVWTAPDGSKYVIHFGAAQLEGGVLDPDRSRGKTSDEGERTISGNTREANRIAASGKIAQIEQLIRGMEDDIDAYEELLSGRVNLNAEQRRPVFRNGERVNIRLDLISKARLYDVEAHRAAISTDGVYVVPEISPDLAQHIKDHIAQQRQYLEEQKRKLVPLLRARDDHNYQHISSYPAEALEFPFSGYGGRYSDTTADRTQFSDFLPSDRSDEVGVHILRVMPGENVFPAGVGDEERGVVGKHKPVASIVVPRDREKEFQELFPAIVARSIESDIERRGMDLSSPDDEEARTREVSGKTLKWVEFSTKSFVENAPAYDEKSLNYTKPELRERLKREIMAGSKGGKPGQWSARKAQLLANEYRKAGGGYRGRPRKIQRSLKSWTRQKWRTSDGKPAIRKGGTRRYLPAKAWSRLTPAQRAATNRKKIAGSKAGRQFVANTERAESASRSARR